ncbi:MAG: gamma-glutamyltransferase family protein, partial [Acidimicrobiia bacterium]|nr:gamma-glutamyltransferase family protein [Acidimicrobiia bacterium]
GPTDGGTTYLTVLDASGLGISLIQSNFHGVGTGLSAGTTGVWLHNRGAGFNLMEGHANELAPGKRPMHTLSPTSWTRGDRLELLLGTRGGHQQPQLLLQALAALFHANLTPAEAQGLPRWTTSEWKPATRSRILVEDGFEAASALAAMGHDVDPEPKGRQGGWGPISLIRVGDDGMATGAADPRVSTSSARSRKST